MSQYLPPQKTLPERMASIETLWTQFIREFGNYQREQKEEHEVLKATLKEMQSKIEVHVNSDGETWRKLKWEMLKYIVLFILGMIATAVWALVLQGKI